MGTEVCRGSLFRFGLFEADASRGTLIRNGAPVKIQDQPFRVLVHLLEHAGATVTRDELRRLLWGDETFVDFDASLNVILKKLRAALRDDSENPRFIATVPRHGYRFLAPVAVADSDSNRGQDSLNDAILKGGGTTEAVARINAAGLTARWQRSTMLSAIVAALAVSATLVVMNWKRAATVSAPVVRSSVLAPHDTSFVSTSLAISPDGGVLAFVANVSNGGPAALWLQTMNSGSAHPLSGTEGATLPFWSPDSQHLGFFSHGKLWRIDKQGGPPQPLCDASLGRGGTWNEHNVILFAPDINGPLQEISAHGGAAKVVLPLDSPNGTVHAWWPQFLPDGKHFIYWSHTNTSTDVDGIYVSELGSNERRLLVPTESNGLYAADHLLYMHDQTLLADSFDLNHLSLSAAPEPLAEGIGIHQGMHLADFTASQNGLLAYFPGRANRGWPMVLYDGSGKPQGRIFSQRDIFVDPRFSPDGKRLAVSIARSDSTLDDLWVIDVQLGTRTRMTFVSGDATHPVWSADQNTIYYSAANGPDRLPHIYERLANGVGDEKPILATAGVSEVPMDISKDGSHLAYARRENGKQWEVWMLPLLKTGKPFAFVGLPRSNVTDPAFSPDGKRVAYSSDETGDSEIYISPLVGSGKWQVSTGGGSDPVWAPDGRRLYFMDGAQNIMYVHVRASRSGVKLNKPVLFDENATFPMPRPLAAAPDGRLLVDGHDDEPTPTATITLVTNWPTQLKQ